MASPSTPGPIPNGSNGQPAERKKTQRGTKGNRRRQRARPTVKAPVHRGQNLMSRPLPPGVPSGLHRGSADYHRWEAWQILELRAAGMAPGAIQERLGMTVEEYRDRRELIRKEADVGDALLAWTEYQAGTARHLEDAERTMRGAIAKGDLGVQVRALRLMHDIQTDAMKIGVDVGVFARVNQGTGLSTLADLVRRVSFKVELNGEAGRA